MPETCVNDAMKKAKFTKGSIKGLKAYTVGLLLPQPDWIMDKNNKDNIPSVGSTRGNHVSG